jgi:hypothetical protein
MAVIGRADGTLAVHGGADELITVAEDAFGAFAVAGAADGAAVIL